MAEYIERETAIRALMNDAPEQVGYCREDAADCIRYMPAADVVEVVRCKSCSKRIVSETGRRFCSAPLGTLGCVPVGDNDFCSRGERRDDHAAD